MSGRRLALAQSGFARSNSTYSLFSRPVARTSMGLSLISLIVEIPANGRKKPKWSAKRGYSVARVSPLPTSSASSVIPSVARMNLALAWPVFGLARSVASVSPTLPISHTAMWMLLRWSTPPGRSEALESPLRRRLSVVSLLPNAARNEKGNSAASKEARANSEIACSISTAFMRELTTSAQSSIEPYRSGEQPYDILSQWHPQAFRPLVAKQKQLD